MSSRWTGRPPLRRVPAPATSSATAGTEGGAPPALTVSAFVARVNSALRAALPDSWVRGEVGEWRVWPSGHAYFTLKDESSTLNAVMWAGEVRGLRFSVAPGLAVLARGRADVYGRTGKLSFVVSELQPDGLGALQLALEQLKARLAAEGLFDPARKRPLPALPRRIGVVSSPRGAAFRDILKVLSARFPGAHVVLWPAAVQGESAVADVVRAVEGFSRTRAVDVVIVARGGGSREDLAAFDDERVVRAVAASAVPTISAVGHEVDVTLVDLAADVRAATPSQAAELVVARRDELSAAAQRAERAVVAGLRSRLSDARATLLALEGEEALAGFPARARAGGERAAALSRALVSAVRGLPARFRESFLEAEGALLGWPARAALPLRAQALARDERALRDRTAARVLAAGEALEAAAGRLHALSPLRVLARGYAVAYREAESVAKPLLDAGGLAAGDAIAVRLARGTFGAKVTWTAPGGTPLAGPGEGKDVEQGEAPEEPDV